MSDMPSPTENARPMSDRGERLSRAIAKAVVAHLAVEGGPDPEVVTFIPQAGVLKVRYHGDFVGGPSTFNVSVTEDQR